jgi:pimeloyl-ACP methyl ester carboxylesterase
MARKRPLGVARSLNTFGLFRDHETDWLFKRTLEYMGVGCAEIGECLHAARGIDERDPETWISGWAALAGRVEAQGEESLAGGHRVSARNSFLRAMNYYRTAEYACAPDHPRFRELWRKSVDCMGKAIPSMPGFLRKVEIPFERWKLPGYIWSPDASGKRRPTLIFVGGNDSSGEEMLMAAGGAAVDRGYNYFTFEYPGHRGAVHLQPDCVRRPDMEVPFKAAIDFILAQSGVDERIALAGFSFGGYVAARVAAFEKRIKAVIPDSPLIDVSELMNRLMKSPLGRIPDRLLDVVLKRRLRRSQILVNFFRYGAWTLGRNETSMARIARLDYSAYTVRDRLSHIVCPALALVGAGEGEIMVRQAREFYNGIGSTVKKLHVFELEKDGSDDHCQLDNITRGMQVAFDWLDGVLGWKGR